MAEGSLTALFPGVPFQVAGERLTLRPITLADLPAVERVQAGWRVLLVSAGEVLDREAWADFLDLLAAATGRDGAWVRSLAAPAFEHLVAGVLAINQEVLDPPPAPAPDVNLDWPQIAARLVADGHPWEAVQRMTLSQARAFLTESYRRERAQLAAGIVASSYAMADPKAVQRTVTELRRG